MYASINYYKKEFLGSKELNSDEEIEKYLTLSSRKIDEVTYNRIEIKGIANLTDFQQKKIKEATCYQANYMFENGIEPSNIVGYCVIDISVSVSRNNSLAADLNMSEVSYSILKQTGLVCGVL